jgi:type I restriction enzyme M protein
MDNKKEQERAELHKTIWGMANGLRGAVDGWDFKAYVLETLFYRYISENLTAYVNKGEHEAGDSSFDYANLDDKTAETQKKALVKEKGFFIYPSELFGNIKEKAKDDENLNMTLEKAFKHIEESAMGTDSEEDFKGLFSDFDVNSAKLGNTVKDRNKRLLALLDGVGSMKLGNVDDATIDTFGDAYEYLMTMYASNAGKSGGEFFTPQEVSRLLTLLALGDRKHVNKVYEIKTQNLIQNKVA